MTDILRTHTKVPKNRKWNVRRIVILTGSGISAESGLHTFRDKGGLWEKYDLMELATPEAFARNPARVHEFYNLRRAGLREVSPNAAHEALVRLEREFPGDVFLITQNVDDLHERAGSRTLYHMHGELCKIRCTVCGVVKNWSRELTVTTPCPACDTSGTLRPHIVWFGEVPFYMTEIEALLRECDLFLSIGTSGTVYPAAGFAARAKAGGARTVELNLEPSQGQGTEREVDQGELFDEGYYGPATRVVPAFVDELLKETTE